MSGSWNIRNYSASKHVLRPWSPRGDLSRRKQKKNTHTLKAIDSFLSICRNPFETHLPAAAQMSKAISWSPSRYPHVNKQNQKHALTHTHSQIQGSCLVKLPRFKPNLYNFPTPLERTRSLRESKCFVTHPHTLSHQSTHINIHKKTHSLTHKQEKKRKPKQTETPQKTKTNRNKQIEVPIVPRVLSGRSSETTAATAAAAYV